MTAEQIIALVQSMDPIEVERLLTLLKEYEVELRRHPQPELKSVSPPPSAAETEILLKLNALELREREAQSNME